MPATRKVSLRKRARSSSEDSEPESLHSDTLDDPPIKKRARPTPSRPNSSSKPKPKSRKRRINEDAEEEDNRSGVDLKDGQQVVGRVVQAPKIGWGNAGPLTCILDARSTSLISKGLLAGFHKTRSISSRNSKTPLVTTANGLYYLSVRNIVVDIYPRFKLHGMQCQCIRVEHSLN